jgi:predicted DNA-binding antitoxin AbrB/MazE fold protein
MNQIEAIFQGGVFRPLHSVNLPENQRVTLTVQPLRVNEVRVWLDQVHQLHQQIIKRRGVFRDTTPDIAADRMRDD